MKKTLIILIISILTFIKLSAQNCNADFVFTSNPTGLVNFQDQSETYGATLCEIYWEFGDGETSVDVNPVHQYNANGQYEVCMYIGTSFDTLCLSIGCIDSVCYILDVTTITPCNLSLSYLQTNVSINGGNDGGIDLTVNNAQAPISYQWSSGQITEDISGLTAGDYKVVVADNNNCIDSLIITITEPLAIVEYSLLGQVFAKTALLPEGIALLINDVNLVVAKTEIHAGQYQFLNIDSGQYTVYAVPYFNLDYEYFPIYFPSYIGDVSYWNLSNLILVDSIRSANIHLNSYQEVLHGQGNISGKVKYEEDSGFETNFYQQNWFSNFKNVSNSLASNVTVLLRDQSNTIVDFCLTNESGQYIFDNIPFGFYSVHVEKSGKIMLPISVNLNQENDNIENVDLTIQSAQIISVPKHAFLEKDITIYPNPFNNQIKIELPFTGLNYEVQIIDIAGRTVLFQNKFKESILINTDNIEKGVYIIVCKSNGNGIFVKNIIKY